MTAGEHDKHAFTFGVEAMGGKFVIGITAVDGVPVPHLPVDSGSPSRMAANAVCDALNRGLLTAAWEAIFAVIGLEPGMTDEELVLIVTGIGQGDNNAEGH